MKSTEHKPDIDINRILRQAHADNSEVRSKALQRLQKVADSAHYRAHEAQFELGVLLVKSASTQVDVEKGMVYLERASANQPHAAELLGHIYYTGEGGIGKDALKSKRWYEMSAEAGCAQSQYMCGVICTTDKTKRLSYAEGIRWLQKSVAQKYEPAIIYFEDMLRDFTTSLNEALPDVRSRNRHARRLMMH